MRSYHIIPGSIAEKNLVHDYKAILSVTSTELSEAEFRRLTEIAHIGYEYASQKDCYLTALYDTVEEWVAEAQRTKIHLVQISSKKDLDVCYNTAEVKKIMSNSHLSVIPTFFVGFGAVVLALFCISATIFTIGICQGFLPINPVYLFMITVGFLGLLMTDVVAIAEWRKAQNVRQ